MLVFYTWSIRLLADSIGLFGSAEKLTWLANHTPQEGGRLNPPAPANSKDPDAGKEKSSVGKSLPKPAEDEHALVPVGVPHGWPRSGAIAFDAVVMKYAPHLPPALRGVSFNIKSGEKVGVVGRTGSGKSTLLLALYRMFNLEGGSITLDGVDISTLTLNTLRRGLSVIPQEPVVFSGTVRTNLDPFGEYGHDGLLWEAIKDCGLEEQVGGRAGRVDGKQLVLLVLVGSVCPDPDPGCFCTFYMSCSIHVPCWAQCSLLHPSLPACLPACLPG
jgi:ATP-binding cassette subfamily C (CFTR/MRP) protein 1